MVKYKATELILGAMQLADLTNSSFITAEENRMWLNTAYEQLYQNAINNGETAWDKWTYLINGDTLPEDFYQLKEIYDDAGNPIPKRQKGQLATNTSAPYYYLLNNTLHLNKKSTAQICYVPVPETLPLESDGEEVELSYPSTLFYNLMMFKLAMYYKIKQGADISGIELLYADAEDQYYNMLKQDINANYVMNDYYESRMFF